MRSAEGDAHRAEVARAYMSHVRDLGRAAERLREEIDAARDAMPPGGVRYDAAPKGPGAYGDAIPDAVAELEGMIAEYAAELAGCAEETRRAHEALRRLSGERGRYVLTAHYLLGRTWEEVAAEIGYSAAWTKEVARAALAELYDFLPPGWREPRHPAI